MNMDTCPVCGGPLEHYEDAFIRSPDRSDTVLVPEVWMCHYQPCLEMYFPPGVYDWWLHGEKSEDFLLTYPHYRPK